jgi:hypothetical protein
VPLVSLIRNGFCTTSQQQYFLCTYFIVLLWRILYSFYCYYLILRRMQLVLDSDHETNIWKLLLSNGFAKQAYFYDNKRIKWEGTMFPVHAEILWVGYVYRQWIPYWRVVVTGARGQFENAEERESPQLEAVTRRGGSFFLLCVNIWPNTYAQTGPHAIKL